MKRGAVISWDVALFVGIVLLLALNGAGNLFLIAGFCTVLIFSNCLRNHIAVYKLTGKIY